MVVQSTAKPTKLAMPIISDENIVDVTILATGEKKLDVEYLLDLVENILLTAADVQYEAPEGNIEFRRPSFSFKSPSCTLKQISCELTACMAQDDLVNIEKTVVAIINLLSSYSLDAKLVLSLAALALEFGEFWRLRKDLSTDHKSSLPKEFCLSMATLKFVSGYINPEHQHMPVQLDELNRLTMLILEVTKSIVELEKLRTQFNTSNVTGLLATIQKHAYWTITAIVACATHITILKSHDGQPQDLSQWIEYLVYIHEDLEKHKRICEQQKEMEVYWKLNSILNNSYHESSFEIVEVLKLLICTDNDAQPLHINDGSTTMGLSIDVLSKKDVLLLISSLDISDIDIKHLLEIHEGIKGYNYYKIVWIPIVEQWTLEQLQMFMKLRDQMPWYVVHMVSPLAGIRFIREEWHFNGKPILVLMNKQGEVENPNALPLIRLRGMEAFPFTKTAEDSIRTLENWLGLVAKYIHPTMQSWIKEEKYVFFCGGTDKAWIKKFQEYIKDLDLGKFSSHEEGNNTIESIDVGDQSEMGFWNIIESLFCIKVQDGIDNDIDETLQVLQKLLSYKTERWAVLAKGSTVIVADHGTKISRALKKLAMVMKQSDDQEHHFHEEDKFETIFKRYYEEVVKEFRHSFQIISTAEKIPKTMKCLECGEHMETFVGYRCNNNSFQKQNVIIQPRHVFNNYGHQTNVFNEAPKKPPPKVVQYQLLVRPRPRPPQRRPGAPIIIYN